MKNIDGANVTETTGNALSNSAIRQKIKENLPDIRDKIEHIAPACGYYNQEDLSRAIPCSREFLNKALNGRVPFPVDKIKRIAELLQCDFRYLIGLVSDPDRQQAEKEHADYRRDYIDSFGVEYTKDGRPFMRQKDFGGCIRHALTEDEFENLLEHIDSVVSELLYYEFFYHGRYIWPKERNKRQQAEREKP